MAIPKKDFSDCFEKWKECWDKCVRSQGEYFEGDQGTIVLGQLLYLILIGWILSRQTMQMNDFVINSSILLRDSPRRSVNKPQGKIEVVCKVMVHHWEGISWLNFNVKLI